MLDAHFHLDKYQNPERELEAIKENGIRAIAVSNNINSYVRTRLLAQEQKDISVAIGFHPLELSRWDWELEEVLAIMELEPFIGEVGLDGRDPLTKKKRPVQEIDRQIRTLEAIFKTCEGKEKIFTLHSQDAESLLIEVIKGRNLPRVIWHWYTGSETSLHKIIDMGHYLSVGPFVAKHKSRMGNWIGDWIPRERILTETDGPYGNKGLLRRDALRVANHAIATKWRCLDEEAEQLVMNNFRALTKDIPNTL
jgi:TatD DNase family protein